MLRGLGSFAQGFTRTQNLDLLTMALLAVFGTVMSFFDIKIALGALLAVLTVNVVNLMKQRNFVDESSQLLKRTNETVEGLTKQSLASMEYDDFRVPMRQALKAAKEVRILAVSPSSFLRECEDELKTVLSRDDGKVHFLVVDPQSEAMKVIEKGLRVQVIDGRRFQEEVCRNFGEALANKRLRVSMVDYVPGQIITILDSQAFVTENSFQQHDPGRPARKVTQSDARDWRFICNEFDQLIKVSKPLDCVDAASKPKPGASEAGEGSGGIAQG